MRLISIIVLLYIAQHDLQAKCLTKVSQRTGGS
jgi:hypothetical protein